MLKGVLVGTVLVIGMAAITIWHQRSFPEPCTPGKEDPYAEKVCGKDHHWHSDPMHKWSKGSDDGFWYVSD